MQGLFFFLIYMLGGLWMVRCLLPRHPMLNRVWLGLSLGVLLMMWLPALCAFGFGFTLTAHYFSLLPLVLLSAGCYAVRDKHPCKPFDEEEKRLLITSAFFVVPLTLLSAWLQYSHNLRPLPDGSLNVGQSTYGDLSMHLGFITGMVGQSFPPQYSFYTGHQLAYPFLADSLSTSFYLLGWSLQAAIDIPGTLMMFLCYAGVILLARDMTSGKKTVFLALLLFFLNGGLGFLYDFDLAGGFAADGAPNAWHRILNILTGFYTTPTNQPDPNNLRWSNVIADLMLPQRTLLGGWAMVLPCFYLLYTAFVREHRGERGGVRAELLLGIWGGALPLIHTHTYLALVLSSAGFFLYDLLHEKEKLPTFLRYLRYGAVAAALSLPQLILFTFPQTFQAAGAEGSGNSFIIFHFNWANNRGGGLRDMYLWFYIKNIGLPFIALLLALLEKNARHRRLFAGAAVIILVAEFIRFQPNEYDNNKLLYLAWLLCCMITADWFAEMWRRMKGMRGRPVLAAVTAVCLFLSAGLTLWREAVSDYQAYGAGAVEAAEYIKANSKQDDIFLTGTQHLNPVCSLAGRRIICGSDLYLYFHGFNTAERKEDITRFYTDPADNGDVLEKYGISYIFVSSYERGSYDVDFDALDSLYEQVFSNWEAVIYKVPEG